MRNIKYIFVNETSSPSPTPDALGSIVSDFRYSHIIDAAGLSRTELIKLLVFARSHYPEAKILGLSEINGRSIRPNDSMNQLRRELSEQREQCELVQSLSSRDKSLHGKLSDYT